MKMLMEFMNAHYDGNLPLRLLAIGACTALSAGAQFISTWYVGVIMNTIAQGPSAVLRYFAVIAVAVVVYTISNTAYEYASGRMANRFLRGLRARLGEKLCKADHASLEKIPESDLFYILIRDTEGFRPWLAALSSLGQTPVKLVVAMIAIFALSWELSLAMLPMMPLVMLPSLLLSKKLHSMQADEKAAMAKASGFLQEMLDFVLVIKAYCLEGLFSVKSRTRLCDVERTRRRRQLREQMVQTFGRCLGHVINPLMFIFGGYLVLQGRMTIGNIVTVMLLTNIIGEALNLIYAVPTAYQEARASMERVAKVLASPDAMPREGGAGPRGEEEGALDVRRISFSYDCASILREISFSVQRGEKIAVVGASGSGKTTLLKVMCALLPTDSGEIALLGTDVASVPPGDTWEQLAVAPQEPFLFPDTLANNVLIARPNAALHDVRQACKRARIAEFIEALPAGYDTRLGDIGASMSKGQMQRVNLARVFLRDAPVWMLDEPLSALDPDTHDEILRDILSQDRTVLMVLHEMKWPKKFHKILYLRDGAVEGFAPHEALLCESAEYRAMLTQRNHEEMQS